VLASTSYFVSTLARPGGDQLKLAGPLITGGLLGKGTGIGFRKSDPELRAMFDKALGEALADGTVKKLSLQWFKTDISPQS
jgi:octopine/nopaline transport system substrate-binding protein